MNIFEDFIYFILFFCILKIIKSFITKIFVQKLLEINKINLPENKIIKLGLSIWKTFYYGYSAIKGSMVLSNESWFNKPKEYIIENIPMSNNIKKYYILSTCYYFIEISDIFCEPKRKDSFEMLIHHIFTLFLLIASYFLNAYRYGSLIIILHDIADPFLESAKILIYLKFKKFADIQFTIFACVFFTTRLYFYPVHIIKCAITDYIKDGMTKIRILLILALSGLQLLHVFWGYYIVKMTYRLMFTKKMEDVRSQEK